MSPLRLTYLGLAAAGAALPLRPVAERLADGRFSVAELQAVWPTAGAQGATALIILAALALWVVSETWVRRNWIALVALPATWFVGLSFGLPLYLFLRTARVT